MGKSEGLSHVDEAGRARMVDVSGKPRVRRTASAAATIHLAAQTVRLIRENLIQKGDVLAVARVAGIAGAKRASELIPLCHNIAIDQVEVDFTVGETAIDIRCRAVCTDKTGIEMEALTGAAVAALTIYDMCKAVDRGMVIGELRLLEKTKEEAPQAAAAPEGDAP
jgi:cyclic pyranopterin phosphate synthase